jgi:hypothetical protein
MELVVRAVGDALRRHLNASDLVPHLEAMRTLPTVRLRPKMVPTGTNVFTDRPEGRQKALGMTGGLETLHDPLAFPRRLV